MRECHGQVVRTTWLWCRKLREGHEFELGLCYLKTGKLYQACSKWVPVSILGKDEAVKEAGGLRLSPAVPKVHWASDPHCPYG